MKTAPGTHAERPAHERNVEAFIDYWRSGFTPVTGKVGIELEHIVVTDDGSPVTYDGPDGIADLLERLSARYPEKTFDGDDLIGVSRTRGAITEAVTLEPAAQVELSAGPFSTLVDARTSFDDFEETLRDLLAERGQKVDPHGYHPTTRAEDLPLIPKTRYAFMNRYLGGLGPWGPRMMRATASTQVSIDACDEADCLRKMRLSGKLVPILSLICDDSPRFEAGAAPHPCMRTEVWRHCDPDRCNLVPGVTEDGFTLRDYAEYILRTPAILVADASGEWTYDTRTFDEIYADTVMDRDRIEHAVSMLFNDVRLKTYVEIRPADALPVDLVLAYAALVKGLFAGDEQMTAAERVVSACTSDDCIDRAKTAVMADGYDARVYGKPAGEVADALFAIACTGLTDGECRLMEPLLDLVSRRLRPAQI